MGEDLFINDENNRIFSAYATVEITDKQKQFVPISNFKRAFYKFLLKGASLNLGHGNLVIGKVINGEDEITPDGHKAFKIVAQIYSSDPDNPIYDEVWEGIKSGKYSGVSIGGGIPVLNLTSKEGELSEELQTVPLMEISVVEKPANPLALILGMSMAKSDNMAKPGDVDEAKWEEAKKKVREQYPDLSEDDERFYKLTQTIYQNMTKEDTPDVISMDVPLITRVLEYFNENKMDDVKLHVILTNIINASKKGTLNIENYDALIDIKDSEVKKMAEDNPSKTIEEQKETVSETSNNAEMYKMLKEMHTKMFSEEEKKPEEPKESEEPSAEEEKEKEEPKKEEEPKEAEEKKDEIKKEEKKDEVSDISNEEPSKVVSDGDDPEKKVAVESASEVEKSLKKSETKTTPSVLAKESKSKYVWEILVEEKFKR